ncbi:protein-tyrosine phosphatase family protein [Thiolinea disciformis]|uniref:protein-tyrosine phosphatase family protein n=1 Tax=Thiolinea disciformis TaxID=125614 RepID=UPI00036D88F0|nr:dual specificity protein phosphatase family protein [Thiolinea disciformis]
MQSIFFEVKTIGSGRLFIMPCPNGEQLADEMVNYMEAGFNKIVCLLENQEMMRLGVAFEPRLCLQLGMEFEHFPIPDRHTPTRHKPFHELVEKLYQDLQHGKNVAIHCYAGIGRTGVLAGCLLIRDGMSAQDATELLSSIRGHNMPQTQEQYDFLLEWPNAAHTPHKPSSKGWFKRLLTPA